MEIHSGGFLEFVEDLKVCRYQICQVGKRFRVCRVCLYNNFRSSLIIIFYDILG